MAHASVVAKVASPRPFLSGILRKGRLAIEAILERFGWRPKVDYQRVGVFQIGDTIYLETCSARIFGFYATGPVFSCRSDEVIEIGRLALKALECSIPDLDPKLRAEKGRLSPVIKAAGLRSWAALTRCAKYVSVDRKNGAITVLTSENLGPRGGYGGNFECFPSKADPRELGATIMKAMALST